MPIVAIHDVKGGRKWRSFYTRTHTRQTRKTSLASDRSKNTVCNMYDIHTHGVFVAVRRLFAFVRRVYTERSVSD